MPRPQKRRFVTRAPQADIFKPAGVPGRELEQVSLTLDGYEALRLVDLEGMGHAAAAAELGVSRPTLTRILARARRTVAEALVAGKALAIEGGSVTHERPAGPPPWAAGGGPGRARGGRRGGRDAGNRGGGESGAGGLGDRPSSDDHNRGGHPGDCAGGGSNDKDTRS